MIAPASCFREPCRISHRAAVELPHWNACQIDAVKAANIDRRHPVALGIAAFTVWMNPAGRAKAVLDHMLVESIGGEVVVAREYAQLFARDKPQQRAFARTHRAIARRRALQFTFDLERDLATMAAALVIHAGYPSLLRSSIRNLPQGSLCAERSSIHFADYDSAEVI